MYILITYDVNTMTSEGRRRLRKVAKCCCDYGQRVQNSVFECSVTEAQLLILKNRINEIIDSRTDSIRIYNLGKNHNSKIEHIGFSDTYDVEGVLIV